MLIDAHQACQAGDLRPAAQKRLKAEGLGQVRMNYEDSEPLLVIGFKERMLYTAKITFEGIGVRSERQHHGYATSQYDLRQQKRS
jgi:hypothetical protein